MERYIEMFGPTLIVALALYAAVRRLVQWARQPDDPPEDWHPSRHYRGEPVFGSTIQRTTDENDPPGDQAREWRDYQHKREW